ncbi:MAG TPA: type III PLP-dependent enzyme, partial [Alphaproteobacteria bacterium]|nr:type III PLP-dependent enzyme [Alphaproteobacteria bacterium]
SFADATALVAAQKPEYPVYCVRPHVLRKTAEDFIAQFPGKVLYAVKCNPEDPFLHALYAGGIRHFDTASLVEIKQIKTLFPDAECYYMHPVKARSAVRAAYFEHGVRTFVVDHPDELEKVEQETDGARDLTLVVRLATAKGGAVYDLGGKFGATVEGAAALLRAVEAKGHRVGLSFHVGSQCVTPASYGAALELTREVLEMSGVRLSVIDVGGGFPIAYVGVEPPPLSDYVEVIRAGLAQLDLPPDCDVWAEPGRALVGAGASLVVRVELRRGNQLYLNDGVFGSLSDLNVPGCLPPMRLLPQTGGVAAGPLAEFSFFGPTCDSADRMKGPFLLPASVQEGDWIEIGQMGAYTTALRTQFNGFYPELFIHVDDPAYLPETALLAAAE